MDGVITLADRFAEHAGAMSDIAMRMIVKAARKSLAWSRKQREVVKCNRTILSNYVLLRMKKKAVKALTRSSMHFFLDIFLRSLYIWITLRSSSRDADFECLGRINNEVRNQEGR